MALHPSRPGPGGTALSASGKALGELVLASANAGKLRELQALLPRGWCAHPLSDYSGEQAEESGQSFVENAIIKARHACAASGLAALADDSGLMVDALDGAPGVLSARWAGPCADDAANNRLLLERLGDADCRRARFVCVLAYMRHAADPAPAIFEGIWPGRILERAQGDGGFGYDPLFLPDGGQCSAAMLAPQDKNRISHRGLAMRRFVAHIKAL